MDVPTAVKQTIAAFYWLLLTVAWQIIEPAMPVAYAFAGAVGVGILATVIWIVSSMLAARVYREQIRALEARLAAMETRLTVASEQNAVLREANVHYKQDMESALSHIRQLSGEINEMKRQRNETTDCGR